MAATANARAVAGETPGENERQIQCRPNGCENSAPQT